MNELTNKAYRDFINKYWGSRFNKNFIDFYNKYLLSFCMSLNSTNNITELTEIYQYLANVPNK